MESACMVIGLVVISILVIIGVFGSSSVDAESPPLTEEDKLISTQIDYLRSLIPSVSPLHTKIIRQALKPGDKIIAALEGQSMDRMTNRSICCIVLLQDRILNAKYKGGWGAGFDIFPLKNLVNIGFTQNLMGTGVLDISTPGGTTSFQHVGGDQSTFIQTVLDTQSQLLENKAFDDYSQNQTAPIEMKASTPPKSFIDDLERLVKLRELEQISDIEYELLKKKLLQNKVQE